MIVEVLKESIIPTPLMQYNEFYIENVHNDSMIHIWSGVYFKIVPYFMKSKWFLVNNDSFDVIQIYSSFLDEYLIFDTEKIRRKGKSIVRENFFFVGEASGILSNIYHSKTSIPIRIGIDWSVNLSRFFRLPLYEKTEWKKKYLNKYTLIFLWLIVRDSSEMTKCSILFFSLILRCFYLCVALTVCESD